MTPPDDVGEILSAWKAQRDAGEVVDPAEVIRAHPVRAAELRQAFAAFALLERAADDVLPGAAPPVTGAPTSSPTFPARLGDFRLLRPIGLGATGHVYEAEQVSMRRRVALKILHPSMTLTPRAVERFRREAQVAGRLHHTHIVPVYAMGTDDGLSWFAMELIDGQSLGHVIEDLRLLGGAGKDRAAAAAPNSAVTSGFGSTTGRREFHARVAQVFAGVAEALAAAHEAGVVHRDVKPSNLLLDRAGHLKVLDFGLARASEDGLPALTMTGDVVGTPSYMSPEQVRGGAVDGRTDVYGLGATLYELLTLESPHPGRDVAECLRRIVEREPIPPRRIDPRIPKDLETIVLRAIEKSPAQRYGGADAMARDLRAFGDGAAISARRIGPVGRAWRAVRRHRLRAALVGAVLLLAAVAGFFHRARADERDERLLAQSARRASDYDRLVADAARSTSAITGGARTSPSPAGTCTPGPSPWRRTVRRPGTSEPSVEIGSRRSAWPTWRRQRPAASPRAPFGSCGPCCSVSGAPGRKPRRRRRPRTGCRGTTPPAISRRGACRWRKATCGTPKGCSRAPSASRAWSAWWRTRRGVSVPESDRSSARPRARCSTWTHSRRWVIARRT